MSGIGTKSSRSGRVGPPGRLAGFGLFGRFVRAALVIVATAAAVALLLVVLSATRLLPQLRNPFAETTIDRSQPAVLKSITALSRFEAASGSFQVVVDLAHRSSFLPTIFEGTDTLFVGAGTDIAYVDFANLNGTAVVVSADRRAVTIKLPAAQLEPAVLNVRQSYVFAEQQGLLNKIGDFLAGNPNSQQQVYVLAQQKIQTAARHSPLLAQAQRNTQNMLVGLMRSLGFRTVTVTFAAG